MNEQKSQILVTSPLLPNLGEFTNWQYLYGLLIDRKSAKQIKWNR